MLGQQLKDSCSDVDDAELDKQLKELSALWSDLNADLQQRIQYLQGILLRLGQFHPFNYHCAVIRLAVQDNSMRILASF